MDSVPDSVAATNSDAHESKRSAVLAGYYKDDFLARLPQSPMRPHSPLMHRGTWARVMAMRAALRRTAAVCGKDEPLQVLSLGAGFDTLPWMWDEIVAQPYAALVELDCAKVVEEKRKALGRLPQRDERYRLAQVDLRRADDVVAVLDAFDMWRWDRPTVLLSEVVLVYLDPQDSQRCIDVLAARLPRAVAIIYEQIEPNDPFGKVMVQHLEDRGCPLLGIHAYPTLAAYERRFTHAAVAWDTARAWTMFDEFEHLLDDVGVAERMRVLRLEPLDEVEEWTLLMRHYCIAVATRGFAAADSAAILRQNAQGKPAFNPYMD